jgi:hypothetical protein
MATRGETYTIKENIKDDEVLITLKSFTKNWLVGDTNNIFTELYPLVDLYPAADLYPCFETTKRVLYMELLTAADAVLLRKAITVQTGTTTLNSLVYVQPYESIGTIAKVRWYGGDAASLTNGTGTLVDEQAWAEVKTASEALEVDKTDIKW